MKKVLLSLILIGLVFSCNNDDDSETENHTNKVVLLKVDFINNIFEGGKELEFSPASDFTISTTYNSPGDFGDIQLYYQELDEMIFDGTIIWAGLGARSYPTEIDLPNTFPILNDELPLPNIDRFENVIYDEFAYYPDNIEYSNIWNSINNLEVVSEYLDSNPNGKIHLFLYTPGVGIGDPDYWDWYIYLKN